MTITLTLNRFLHALTISVLLIAFVACQKNAASSSPPSTPSNVQMATLSKTLADACATASSTVISLRNNGKITEAETRTVQNYIVLAVNTDKAMNSELVSADDWPTQRSRIIQLWTAAGLSAAKANLSTTAGLVLDIIIVVVNQIMTAIGGPTV